MLNLNEVRLMGQLADEPTFGTTASGKEWMRCRVLTNRPYKDRESGEWREQVEGHNVGTFDRYRVESGKKLKRGDTVYVEGEMRSSQREVQGQTQYFYSVQVPIGGKLHLISSPASRRGGSGTGAGDQDAAQRNEGAGKMREGGDIGGRSPMDDYDDEIPF